MSALDVGCAVGAASFELAKGFDRVLGFDFSRAFVKVCNVMRTKREYKCRYLEQGSIFRETTVCVPEGLDLQVQPP